MAAAPAAGRDRTLSRLADLFVGEAPRLGVPQIAVFDSVFGCIASRATASGRAELAERLADLGNAPPTTVRLLAFDPEVAVARPVLVRSWVLGDGDLIEVAHRRGADHMIAISGRRRISTAVTDVLAAAGVRAVRHSVARNPGAQLSRPTLSALVDECRADDALGDVLGARPDLAEDEAERLLAILKENARARILAALPPQADGAIDRSRQKALQAEYWDASEAVASLVQERPLAEHDLAAWAAADRLRETVCAVASLSGLPIGTVDRVFRETDNDLLLLLAKAHDWSWRTVRLLLRLRDPSLVARHQFRRAEETFDGIATATAQRVVEVLANREAGLEGVPGRPAAQARRNVR